MEFVNEQTSLGNTTHVFKKVFTKELNDGTNSVKIEDLGSSGAPNWQANKEYKANSLVYANEKLYICVEAHTSGTDFATDLLSGKWKFIGNGVGNNVIKEVLYVGTYEERITEASPATTITYQPINSLNGYDYFIFNVAIARSDHETWKQGKNIIVNPAKGWSYDEIKWGSFASNVAVGISVQNNVINFVVNTLTKVGTSVGIYLESVVGIKIQELTTDYLASLAMPSNVFETLITETENIRALYLTSPENGYMVIRTYNSTKTAWVSTIIGSNPALRQYKYDVQTDENNRTSILQPVKKNDRIGIWSDGKTTVDFVYSVGAAKALGLIN